jgi:hypothetical protein
LGELQQRNNPDSPERAFFVAEYGPNDTAVRRLIERARSLPSDDAHQLLAARIAWLGVHEATDVERAALRDAIETARRHGRLGAMEKARAAAAAAFREARHGEVGPWLSVSAAISNAVAATVVADLLNPHNHEILYRPWRHAVAGAELIPVGPGLGTFGAPRRRQVPGRAMLIGTDD